MVPVNAGPAPPPDCLGRRVGADEAVSMAPCGHARVDRPVSSHGCAAPCRFPSGRQHLDCIQRAQAQPHVAYLGAPIPAPARWLDRHRPGRAKRPGAAPRVRCVGGLHLHRQGHVFAQKAGRLPIENFTSMAPRCASTAGAMDSTRAASAAPQTHRPPPRPAGPAAAVPEIARPPGPPAAWARASARLSRALPGCTICPGSTSRTSTRASAGPPAWFAPGGPGSHRGRLGQRRHWAWAWATSVPASAVAFLGLRTELLRPRHVHRPACLRQAAPGCKTPRPPTVAPAPGWRWRLAATHRPAPGRPARRWARAAQAFQPRLCLALRRNGLGQKRHAIRRI